MKIRQLRRKEEERKRKEDEGEMKMPVCHFRVIQLYPKIDVR